MPTVQVKGSVLPSTCVCISNLFLFYISCCVALCLVCTSSIYLIILSVLTSAFSGSSRSLQGPRPRSGCIPPIAICGVSGGPSVPSVQSPHSAPGHSRHSSPPPGSLVCLFSLLYQLYALGCVLLGVCCFPAFRRIHMTIRWSIRLIYFYLG